MISSRILRIIKHPRITKSARQDTFFNITIPPFYLIIAFATHKKGVSVLTLRARIPLLLLSRENVRV